MSCRGGASVTWIFLRVTDRKHSRSETAKHFLTWAPNSKSKPLKTIGGHELTVGRRVREGFILFWTMPRILVVSNNVPSYHFYLMSACISNLSFFLNFVSSVALALCVVPIESLCTCVIQEHEAVIVQLKSEVKLLQEKLAMIQVQWDALTTQQSKRA